MTHPPLADPGLLRRRDRPLERWRNGGGTTRVVAIDPPGAVLANGFRWRVSIASVAADGPFSRLPGTDRILWLLGGKGMRLRVGDRSVMLNRPLQRVDFAGEVPVEAHLIDGPTEDLNVMTDRASVAPAVVVARLEAGAALDVALSAPQNLVVVLSGAPTMEGFAAGLECGDAVRIDGVRSVRWRAPAGPSDLLALGFHPR